MKIANINFFAKLMKIDKSWYEKPKDPNFPVATSAGGVVVRKDNGKLMIALIGTDYHEDYMLPKGAQEKGEGVEDTARREIVEETGLHNLKLICKLGVKERLTFEKDKWKTTHYFLFETKEVSGQQKLEPGEKDLKLSWFDLEKLPPMFFPEQKELIEKNKEKIRKLLSKS